MHDRRAKFAQIFRFGVIGVGVTILDVGIFNLLVATTLSGQPIYAKTISVLVATVVAYLANRHWTFQDSSTPQRGGFALFLVFNLLALVIPAACLAVSHHLLGLRSGLDDNISANVLGSPLAVVLRFWAYKRFIFKAAPTG